MNLELSKGTVITLIVVAVLVVGGIFWKLMQPTVVPFPAGYDPTGRGLPPTSSAPGAPATPAAPTK